MNPNCPLCHKLLSSGSGRVSSPCPRNPLHMVHTDCAANATQCPACRSPLERFQSGLTLARLTGWRPPRPQPPKRPIPGMTSGEDDPWQGPSEWKMPEMRPMDPKLAKEIWKKGRKRAAVDFIKHPFGLGKYKDTRPNPYYDNYMVEEMYLRYPPYDPGRSVNGWM